jgi:hypothetical protein
VRYMANAVGGADGGGVVHGLFCVGDEDLEVRGQVRRRSLDGGQHQSETFRLSIGRYGDRELDRRWLRGRGCFVHERCHR